MSSPMNYDNKYDLDLIVDKLAEDDLYEFAINDYLEDNLDLCAPVLNQEFTSMDNEDQIDTDLLKNTSKYSFDVEVTISDLMQELDSLVGLHPVKEEIRRLIHYVKIQNLRSDYGISESSMVLHSVFYGSPGTGKTTVARLYGRMLKAMGILSKGHLIETDRAGLVANYVGQTATKTDQKVAEAIGGILFIDEAYSLSQEDQSASDFGSEAIQILMKRMEDHRDDFVVIVAGYPGPMKSFLRSNEGFKSRFSTYINFVDFTPEEMVEIFEYFCAKESYDLGTDAIDSVRTAIEFKYTIRDKSFGNARFVRNFFESVIRNHAARVGSLIEEPTPTDLRLLMVDDIPLTIADGG